MTTHINNIFVVENNTVQVYIEQESYLFYCIGTWEKLEHNQQVKHLEMNSEALKKLILQLQKMAAQDLFIF